MDNKTNAAARMGLCLFFNMCAYIERLGSSGLCCENSYGFLEHSCTAHRSLIVVACRTRQQPVVTIIRLQSHKKVCQTYRIS